MDEIAALRSLAADTPPLSARARFNARMRLRYEIAYERPEPRGPIVRPLLAAAATAAMMGGAVAVVGVGEGGPPAPAPPELLTAAATELELAAQVAREQATGPIPRPDQYLYNKEITEERPLDGTGATRTYVDENWIPANGTGRRRNSELGKVWETSGQFWPPQDYETLERLPTDPGQLLLATRDSFTGGTSSAPMSANDFDTAYTFLTSLLFHQPPMPPALRSAAFAAIARIPGVKIADDRVDARGRRGIAINRPPRYDQAIILDALTHEYLGFRNTDVRLDDGERVERVSSRVATAVVDKIGQRPDG